MERRPSSASNGVKAKELGGKTTEITPWLERMSSLSFSGWELWKIPT
jgi:hypothetical protein